MTEGIGERSWVSCKSYEWSQMQVRELKLSNPSVALPLAASTNEIYQMFSYSQIASFSNFHIVSGLVNCDITLIMCCRI